MAGTETFDPRYRGLDTWNDAEILEAFLDGQARAIAAVRPALPAIAAAARAIAERIEPNGRIVYAGAGSSGRQAALDGMELGATFSWPAERIAFVLAEGIALDPGAKGSDEDDTANARAAIVDLKLGAADCVIAVAASGTTPFTLVAAETAKAAGALVVAIANNPGRAALPSRRPCDPARHRARGDRRLDADERRHRPEGDARPSLQPGDDAARAYPRRADGLDAGGLRQARDPRRAHRRRNRRKLAGEGCRSARRVRRPHQAGGPRRSAAPRRRRRTPCSRARVAIFVLRLH